MDLLKYFGLSNPRLFVICLLLALAQGIVFVGAQIAITGAHSFPLDDSYIHLQYARQIACGDYLQYQDDAPVTGGATSFLYIHLLALGYLVGFRGALFPFWVVLITWGCVTLIFYQLVRLGERLGVAWAGRAAVVLTFCSGLMAWGLWSGMEIALFSAILLLTLNQFFQSKFQNYSFYILLALLALSRPEGVIVSVVLMSCLIIQKTTRKDFRSLLGSWSEVLSLFLYTFAIVGPPLFYRMTIGRWGGNGLLAKSLLNHPAMTSTEIVESIISNIVSISFFLLGGMQSSYGEYVIPGFLIFTIIGLISFSVFQGVEGRWRALALVLSLAAVFAAMTTVEVWPMHNYRYITPFFPLMLLISMAGIELIVSRINHKDRTLQYALALMAVLICVVHLPTWASRFADNSTTIFEKQRRAAKWMVDRLPDNEQIAINDAGALVYFGRKQIDQYSPEGKVIKVEKKFHNTDLVGLVTNGSTVPYRLGEGGLYEWMERIPFNKRPQYAAVFPSWFMEMSQIYDIFHQPLVTFPDPFDPGFSKTVYHVNWSYAGMEDQPRKQTMRDEWEIRDSIDIGDLTSENQHNYVLRNRNNRFPDIYAPFRRNFGYHEEIDERWPGIEKEQEYLIPVMRQQGILNQYDIVDGGRRINLDESFTLGNLEPGRDAFLIMRSCECSGLHPLFNYGMDLHVNGFFVASFEMQGTPWNWYEKVITIPGDMINQTDISIRIVNKGSLNFSYYDSFYYWICQGKSKLEL